MADQVADKVADPGGMVAEVAQARKQLVTLRDHGVRWLLDRIGPDGEPATAAQHNGYYRLPWTLAVAGERDAAAAVLAWMEREVLTDDGDLRPGAPRASWTHLAATYPLSIIAHGAWTLERYDTSLAVWGTLRRLQHPTTGGAFWERPEAREKGWQLLFPTAQLGLTALHTGQTDVADAVFGWFDALLAAQPDLPARFHVGWGPDGLVTVIPDGDRYNLLVDFSLPRQAFHNPGIGAAFLARYATRTGHREAGRMARDLLRLHEGATPEQYHHQESTGVCKLGLGSALALELAPDDGLVANLVRMTAWYRDSQSSDGSWAPRTFLRPDPQECHVIEKTAEHVLWVSLMLAALAAHESDLRASGPVAPTITERS